MHGLAIDLLPRTNTQTHACAAVPSSTGKMSGFEICSSIQVNIISMYSGAETRIGFLIFTPSAHKYSYLHKHPPGQR